MNCPEQLVLKTRYLYIWMEGSADIPRKYVPLKEWLNPLRYSFVIQKTWLTPHMNINDSGKYNRKVSNFIFHLKAKFKCTFGNHDYMIGDKCYHCKKEKPSV